MITIADAEGCTPLHYAAHHGLTDMIADLVTPETLNAEDVKQWMPIFYAVTHVRDDCVRALLRKSACNTPHSPTEAGAKLTNSQNYSVVQLAQQQNHPKIVPLFD